MLYVPLGYTFSSDMFETDEVKRGLAYGPGTRQPTELNFSRPFTRVNILLQSQES